MKPEFFTKINQKLHEDEDGKVAWNYNLVKISHLTHYTNEHVRNHQTTNIIISLTPKAHQVTFESWSTFKTKRFNQNTEQPLKRGLTWKPLTGAVGYRTNRSFVTVRRESTAG